MMTTIEMVSAVLIPGHSTNLLLASASSDVAGATNNLPTRVAARPNTIEASAASTTGPASSVRTRRDA